MRTSEVAGKAGVNTQTLRYSALDRTVPGFVDDLEMRVVQSLQDGNVVVARFTCRATRSASAGPRADPAPSLPVGRYPDAIGVQGFRAVVKLARQAR